MKRFLFVLALCLPLTAYGEIPLAEDTAYTLPVNQMPLVGTDGTIDETIAYNESGMELYWNFITTAGVYSCTAVTPTTGGDYDWTHVDGGMYTMKIPASGGASANNDTAGIGWWTGKADGVLAFSSPRFAFSVYGSVAETATAVETEITDRLPTATTKTNLDTAFASTMNEPTGPPAANAPLWTKQSYMYMVWRNKKIANIDANGDGELQFFDDDDNVEFEKTVSTTGDATTEGEARTAD